MVAPETSLAADALLPRSSHLSAIPEQRSSLTHSSRPASPSANRHLVEYEHTRGPKRYRQWNSVRRISESVVEHDISDELSMAEEDRYATRQRPPTRRGPNVTSTSGSGLYQSTPIQDHFISRISKRENSGDTMATSVSRQRSDTVKKWYPPSATSTKIRSAPSNTSGTSHMASQESTFSFNQVASHSRRNPLESTPSHIHHAKNQTPVARSEQSKAQNIMPAFSASTILGSDPHSQPPSNQPAPSSDPPIWRWVSCKNDHSISPSAFENHNQSQPYLHSSSAIHSRMGHHRELSQQSQLAFELSEIPGHRNSWGSFGASSAPPSRDRIQSYRQDYSSVHAPSHPVAVGSERD